MAIAYRDKSEATDAGVVQATIQPAIPAGAVDGDMMDLAVNFQGSRTISTITAGWTLIRNDAQGAVGASASVSRYWKVKAGDLIGPLVTFSATSRCSAAVVALSGVDTAGPDGNAGNAPGSGSTSQVAPTVTPTSGNADDMLLCAWASGMATPAAVVTYTPPGTMTERVDVGPPSVGTNPKSLSMATELLASNAATGTRTATASQNTSYAASSVLYKAAGGTPPDTTRFFSLL